MKKLLLLAALLALATVVHAAKPTNSTELRTYRVTSQTATGTNTLTAFGGTPGDTLGQVRTDSLVVIDYILYSSTAGAADEIWTINVYDANGTAIMPLVAQTVAASAADYILLPFPTGLPLFNVATVSTVVTTGIAPCMTAYNVSVTGPTASGGLTIGWHLENPADRIR